MSLLFAWIYSFHLKEENIYKALKDLLFYLSLIKAPNKIKRKIVLTGMKIGGIYETHKGLMINYYPNEKTIESTIELLNKMNNAVELTVKLIEEFHHNELNDIYHNDFE